MNNRTVVIGVALALAAGVAGADVPSGTYAGFAAGQTKFTASDVEGSESRFTWGVFGGYRFNSYVATELGYYKPSTWSEVEGGESISLSNNTFTGTLLLGAPINDVFSAYARIGAARTKLKLTYDDGEDVFSASDSSTELLYGGGIELSFTKLSLRAEYSKVDTDFIDGGLISVGFLYSFAR